MIEKISQFFDKPILKIAFVLLGLFGAAFGVWSHFENQKNAFLSVYENPERALIASPNDQSGISISLNGVKLEGDVFATQVYVWNSGNDILREENIFEDIKIVPLDGVKIYSVKIIKNSRDITKFSADFSNKKNIELKWNLLEQNDGAIIQIIHTSMANLKSNFRTTGIIEKQGEVSLEVRKSLDFNTSSLIAILCVLIIGIAFLKSAFEKNQNLFFRILSLSLSIFLFWVIIDFLIAFFSSPPSEFMFSESMPH